MQGAGSSIVIDVPPKVIYDIVLDFENYTDFLPDVKDAVIEKKGKPTVATFEISVIKKIRYTLSFNATPHKKIAWTFVKGDLFKDNRGAWEFKEIKKGKTEATYHLEVDFGFAVPSLITNKLVGSSLPTMLKRFKDRAESLAG